MLYLVLDTNVWVSGIISPNSPPAELLRLWQLRTFELVSCQQAMDDLAEVLSRPHLVEKYHILPAKREVLLALIDERVLKVPGNSIQGIVKDDPKDDMFVACAVEGQVKYVISGDKHLLGLRRYQQIRMMKPAYFLALLRRCQRRYT